METFSPGTNELGYTLYYKGLYLLQARNNGDIQFGLVTIESKDILELTKYLTFYREYGSFYMQKQ